MKILQFITLMKNDLRMAWPIFFLGAFYAYLSVTTFREDHLYDFNPITSGGFVLFFMPLGAFNLLFQSENYGFKAPGKFVLGRLEFMFTKAVSRPLLFSAKASLYLILCALPFLMIYAYSHTKPELRIQLPYGETEHRQEVKQFYLSHFEGAYLQKPEVGTTIEYVIFPKGRITLSICVFLMGILVALFFQTLLFAFSRQRWLPFTTLMIFAVVLPFGSLVHRNPSGYEYIMAWISQHTVSAFLGTGLVVIAAEVFCCRRFIKSEVLS